MIEEKRPIAKTAEKLEEERKNMFEILNVLQGFLEWLRQFLNSWTGLFVLALLVFIAIIASAIFRRLGAINDSAHEAASRARAVQAVVEEKIQGYVDELLKTRKYMQKLEDTLEKEKAG